MYPGVKFSSTILAGTVQQSYQFFCLFIEVPLTQNNHNSAHILLFTYGMFFSNPTGPFCAHRRCLICPTVKDRKTDWKLLPVLRMGVQGPHYQDNSNKMWQLQGTITLEINFIGIYVLNYIFLPSYILSISLYITAWKMRKLNKSNVLTSTESINRTLEEKKKMLRK